MIENQKSPSNSCKYCGWEFQNDIIQKIIKEQESAVCEFCGIEINISSISPQEGIIKENYERTSNSKDKVKKKKKSIVKSISKLTKTKKYSVNVIMGDKGFPKIFKENLIVVISRLIYKNIREWEQDNDVNIHQVGLTQSILITLTKKVKPIIDKRIHSSYLENLHELTTEEFEEWLKLLQTKLRSIQEYRKHFIIYLLWLTKLVFRLVSDMWEMKNLPKFQATILKDLKHYPFYLLYYGKDTKNIKMGEDGLPFEEEIDSMEYNVKNFIDELLNILNNYPKEMYNLNPNRVLRGHSGFTLKDLSKLWGHHDGYVSERLQYHKKNSKYILPEKNLNELEKKIRKKFGNKANFCYELINSHKECHISLDLLIKKLRNELGKISKSVTTTLGDIALIFGYGYRMMGYIRGNKNFILTKRRLSIIRDNLKLFLGNKAKKVIKLVEKYENCNPEIPDYANQKYTITKPNFFSDINKDPQIMYWFGWLCSDGWVSQYGNKHYQIQLKLKRKDRIVVEKFATAVGYEQDRIFDETYLYKDENGELRTILSSRVFFGCKPMWFDLVKLGILKFKYKGHVPYIIKDLISQARKANPDGKLILTEDGRLALNFLMGFYDGDGNHHGGMSARF
ncbi:MAG: hypothetical protein CEE43_05505 [Promethearchaeota archaeon Loki_b32]|nr:MAG: hypothetical protein CEE43_05505 [Candidatus Lokiarchaeota archaeon Loki_b32]